MISEDKFRQLTFDKNPKRWFTDILKKPNHSKIPYVRSVQIVTHDFRLWRVNQIMEYWELVDRSEVEKTLDKYNWMYYHCIKYGFRQGLGAEDINIYWVNENTKTPQESDKYLSSLKEMSMEELTQFLKRDPVQIKGTKIINGFHRSCAMIGHLLRGNKYVGIG